MDLRDYIAPKLTLIFLKRLKDRKVQSERTSPKILMQILQDRRLLCLLLKNSTLTIKRSH